MKTNLDEVYNEIDISYKKNGSFDEYNNGIKEEIDSIDRRIDGYDKEIEAKNTKVNSLVESVSQETKESKKDALLQQILNERIIIRTINDKKIELERQKKKLEKRQNNVIGYSKHKDEIEKIKAYKKRIANRANIVKTQIVGFESKISVLRGDIDKINDELDGYSKEMKAQKDLTEELKKELSELQATNTKNMTDDEKNKMFAELKIKSEQIDKAEKAFNSKAIEYNNSMNNRMDKQAEIDKLNKNIDKCNKELNNLQGMSGKCDLAWKTLFTNKDWDEIHKRALGDGKKFTKNDKETDKKELEKTEETENNVKSNIVPIKNTNQQNSLTEVKKPGLFEFIGLKIKSAYKRVKEYFVGNEVEKARAELAQQEAEQKAKQEQEEKAKRQAEREELAAQRTAEIERIKANKEAKKENNLQKDAFLEALRIKTDVKYASENEAKKEQENKTKNVNNKQQDVNEKDEER